MLSKKIENALNEQMKYEYYSSYLYLAMSAYCDSQNMPGFASWMRRQSGEEMAHALKLYDFILNRDGNIKLKSIPEPPQKYTSLEKIFKQVYEHEIHVTGLINKIYRKDKSNTTVFTSFNKFLEKRGFFKPLFFIYTI